MLECKIRHMGFKLGDLRNALVRLNTRQVGASLVSRPHG
jgi:hypothetical protein